MRIVRILLVGVFLLAGLLVFTSGAVKDLFTTGNANDSKTEINIQVSTKLEYTGNPQSPIFENNLNDFNIIGQLFETDVGSYQVILSIKDTEKFCFAEGEINYVVDWEIIPAKVDLPKPVDLFYNQNSQNPEIKDTDVYTVSGTLSEINVGDYSVTLTLNNTKNYTWFDGSISPKDVVWNIAKAEGQASANISGWAYKESPSTLTYESETNTITDILFKLRDSDDGWLDWLIEKPFNAGPYLIKIIFAENDNYLGFEKVIEFDISKAKIIKPSSNGDLLYTGELQNSGIEEHEGYTMSGSTCATEIGDYVVTITLNPNYCWAGDENNFNSIEIKWSIYKEAPLIEIEDDIESENKEETKEELSVDAKSTTQDVTKAFSYDYRKKLVVSWIDITVFCLGCIVCVALSVFSMMKNEKKKKL